MYPCEELMKQTFKCCAGPRKSISTHWMQPTGIAGCIPIGHVTFLVPKSLSHSCHRCWLILSTVPFTWFYSRSCPFAQTISVRWNGLFGSLDLGWRYRKYVQGGRWQFHISLRWHISLLVPAPPSEGSEQYKELEGENTQSHVRNKNGGALAERTRRHMRDTSSFSGEEAYLEACRLRFPRRRTYRRYSVDMESHSKKVTTSVNPLSPGKASFAGMALTQAEPVLGWQPSAGNNTQTGLNNFVFIAIILTCLFMAIITGFPFMVVSKGCFWFVCLF